MKKQKTNAVALIYHLDFTRVGHSHSKLLTNIRNMAHASFNDVSAYIKMKGQEGSARKCLLPLIVLTKWNN